MNFGWRGFWIGMRRIGKGEYGKGLKLEIFYFKIKNFSYFFFFSGKFI